MKGENVVFNIVKKEIEWGGKTLSIETGKIARQASGSVIAKMGNTTVLCAVTIANKAVEGVDFFPLTVHYIEKYYAAGKIPGGFFKREAKPSEASVLVSRLIDRPIRPLFPAGFYNEVNVICTVLSYDPSCNPDIVALIGASAALSISGAPFEGPVAASRVGYINEQFVLNPSNEELKNSSLDLIVSGTKSSVLMVESEAKELSEAKMLEAVEFGHRSFQPIINLISEFSDSASKKKIDFIAQENSQLKNEIKSFIADRLINAYKKQEKQDRVADLEKIQNDVEEKFINEELGIDKNKIKSIFKNLSQDIVRNDILANNVRIDGRKPDQIRPISVETSFLPQVHGCALFTRGETQALVITTLGSSKDEQMVESLDPVMGKESFMLHYNFPPYSVGEVGQLKPPGRREIGHGKLAWRAINPVFPNAHESFSYVTRVVSEITESNGSSSMATVCGTSLSLMDAGVPISSPVSGIAMGLIKEGEKYVILSDIMGDEDHLGDMDFKVAGTKNGITALQMDIKINGITFEIMEKSLKQALEGRIYILDRMCEALSAPRTELNPNVPKVETISIPQKKIREVIGSRGKVIKEICSVSGATVDIDDDGTVKVSSNNNDSIKKALAMINDIIFEPEIGDIYEGPVVKVIDAGAFINISNNRDGFVHISELADHRVDFVEDVINEGDIVKVKVIGFDKKGRPKLSYRCVNQQSGEDISDKIVNKPQMIDEREFSSGKNQRRSGSKDHREHDDRRERRPTRDREDRRPSSADANYKKPRFGGFFGG
jgi:polyribonucleotide nucleotidyltransferase